MRHEILSASKAKATLLELIRRADTCGEAFVLTKDGQAVAALVPMEDYHALEETLEVEGDSSLMDALQLALTQAKQGKLWERDATGKWKRAARSRRQPA